jgi:hypothetical protein
MWANLLASEANSPGKVSRKTVNLVATLEKTDAQLFTDLCSFAWMIGDLTVIIPLIDHSAITRKNITFSTLNHLDDIGLVKFNTLAEFKKIGLPRIFTIFYYGTPLILELPDDNGEFTLGKILLTKAGSQLAEICGSKPSQEYFDHILSVWIEAGIILYSPLGRKA